MSGETVGGSGDRSVPSFASDYMVAFAEVLKGIVATTKTGSSIEIDTAAAQVVELIKQARNTGGKIILVGNGGSAAVVSHMQNDLSKAGQFRAMVFTEQPLLTAYANDEGFEAAYPALTSLWVDEQDLVIAVSSSGASKNILDVCHVAIEAGASVVTMSGFSEANSLRALGEINFYAFSSHYGYVETAHAALGHFLTDSAAGFLANDVVL